MTNRTVCVGVVAIKDNSVLLVKHTKNARLPTDAYGFPAGRFDKEIDDSLKTATVREFEEETGLQTQIDYLVPLEVKRSTLKMKNGTEDFEFHPYYCKKYWGDLKPSKQNIPEFVEITDLNKIQVIADDVKEISKNVYFKIKTIESYDKNVKEFSKKFKDSMDLEKRYEFQRFIDLLNDKKILDLGCGSGEHSLFFKEKGFNITAVDLSENMIKICKEKNLDAFVMDIENLNFKEKSFDGIWAVSSLLHIPKQKMKEILKKLNSILKDNGILYVCVKKGEGEQLIKDNFSNTSRFFSFWQKDEMKKTFENYFALIESKKAELPNKILLQAFFRKIL